MISHRHTHIRGFTLVELLVVIAIIGLLSSVVVASLNTARNKANDARRVADLRQMQRAIETYYLDHEGSYPPVTFHTSTWYPWGSQCADGGGLAAGQVVPGLVPNYIPSMPADPRMNTTANTCCYMYRSEAPDAAGKIKGYKLLVAHSCTNVDYKKYPSLIDPRRDGGTNNSVLDGSAPWAWGVYGPEFMADR